MGPVVLNCFCQSYQGLKTRQGEAQASQDGGKSGVGGQQHKRITWVRIRPEWTCAAHRRFRVTSNSKRQIARDAVLGGAALLA